MEVEYVQHTARVAEGKEKVGGEKGRGTGFTWCKSELKTIEERMNVKRICTPRNIGGKPPKFNH